MLVKSIVWDSHFFELKVGQLNTSDFDVDAFEKQKNQFDLIYLEETENSCRNRNIVESLIQFSDRKVVYTKKINDSTTIDSNITEYNHNVANEELIKLTLEAGEYSRFKMDTNFKKKSYEHLYTKWIQNSCNKEIAFCVLIYGDIKKPSGLITIEKNKSVAQVGLFAVDKEFRENGIGKKLIQAAEYYAKKNNFDVLNITTQANNIAACKLYEKCGFTIESKINIHHYWNKKNEHTF